MNRSRTERQPAKNRIPDDSEYNWQKSTGQCALFDRPGEYFDAAGYEAGFKQQVTQ